MKHLKYKQEAERIFKKLQKELKGRDLTIEEPKYLSERHRELAVKWRKATRKEIKHRKEVGLEPKKVCFYGMGWGECFPECQNFVCRLHKKPKELSKLFERGTI